MPFIEPSEHFFRQRQTAGGGRQLGCIIGSRRVAQGGNRLAARLAGRASGCTGEAIGDVAGAARNAAQAGRTACCQVTSAAIQQFLTLSTCLARFALRTSRCCPEAILRVHGFGKFVEFTHLQLQFQGDRFQRLGAQLLQVGGLGGEVDVIATIQATTELQRNALGAVLLDGCQLIAEQFQPLAGSQALCAVRGLFQLGQLLVDAGQPLPVVLERQGLPADEGQPGEQRHCNGNRANRPVAAVA
ncbi:RND transporter [Pseudomonas syringae pv. spinaceae]|uniref:RND transporter n=1 Tax=Pseudomonas syringae pv. spinaceae TaxID=264459 RepID=A0A0Q0HHU2_PSESX|nr:RND transporter [Pseudomonas syringae pv. spinaceae]